VVCDCLDAIEETNGTYYVRVCVMLLLLLLLLLLHLPLYSTSIRLRRCTHSQINNYAILDALLTDVCGEKVEQLQKITELIGQSYRVQGLFVVVGIGLAVFIVAVF
jgi:hypothetical protein